MNKRKFKTRLIYFFGALGGLLFGYDTGVIAIALTYIKKDITLSTTQLSSAAEGLIVSGVLWGAIPGAVLSGPLSDRFGRKRVIIALGFLFTVGALGCAWAPTVSMLIFSRIILGVAVGGASGLVPVYLSEIAPAGSRGMIGGINTSMNAVGILMAYIFGNICAATADWRMMVGLAVIPAIMLMVGMIFMPESPRWLLQNVSEEASRKVLLMMRNEQEVEAEIAEINLANEMEKKQNQSIWKMLSELWVRKLILIGIGLAIGQQILGAQVLLYYTPTILLGVGFSEQFALLSTLGIGIINLFFTFLGMALIDRWGRKKLLIAGNFLMCVSIALLGSLGLLNISSGPLMLICMCLFMVGFSSTWGMTVWVVLSEIFPLKIRGFGMGICSTCLWVVCALVSQFFPILSDIIGYYTIFLIFAGINVVALLYVAFQLPETKGYSLEMIEMNMQARYEKRPKEHLFESS
jgi:sugar porter (SP) family MFS transporter